ncbi:hypothetical protein ACIOD1_17055 [Streptomyces sp. NPDC088097]|uniref:hypothetical protein n=1 Tax=Streptomyces sp. NPDC088097 TaxID=3365823 RepID=UPI00381CA2DA
MTALHTNPLFARLANVERILVAGAGGGFDVYSGLPIALSLLHQGKEVHLANLSFSALAGLPSQDWVARTWPPSPPGPRRTSRTRN